MTETPLSDQKSAALSRRWLGVSILDIVDVVVYIVVISVFVVFFPQVISESFVMIVLTAILLKIVLELVVWLKAGIKQRIKNASTVLVRVLNIVTLVVLVPGSKVLVVELTALVFRGSVQLGGFLSVTALIVVLMLCRAGVRRAVQPRTAKTAS